MRNLTYIVIDGQTIYDIAIQFYGSIDGVFLLLQDNPTLNGLDTILTAGQKLKIKSDAIDADAVEYFKKNNIVPCSEVEDILDFEITPDGGDHNNDFNNDFNII